MKSVLPALSLLGLLIAPSASAVVVWADNFNSRSSLTDYDYPGGAAGGDYGSPVGTFSIASGYLNVSDTTSSQANLATFANQYAQSSYAAGDKVTVTYDFRVNNLNGAAASVARLSVMNANPATGSEAFCIGFSYADYAGAPAGSLGFFWGTAANAAPNVNRGIGANATGFTFGTYDGAVATNNDTNFDGSTPSWYRISYTMTQGSTAVAGSITRLDGSGNTTANSASFNATLASALNWTASTNDGIRITSGASGTGSFDFDNISIDVVPEPSALVLTGLASVTLLRRRRN